jgi:hypothetical protein
MLMMLVAGVLVILAISLSSPRVACHYHYASVEGDDAQLHRLCKMIRHDDPDWWARHCRI